MIKIDGWISLHRKLLENPVVCKDSDHLAVWVYLLLNATHTDYDVIFNNKRTTLKPGELVTGRKSISSKIKITESKVQRILKTFEIEHQIEQQTTSQNRLISILNWNQYQQSEQPTEQQLNNNRTTTEQQLNTNNNIITEQQNNSLYIYLEERWSLPINASIVEDLDHLVNEYGEEKVKAGIDICLEQNVRAIKYLRGVVRNGSNRKEAKSEPGRENLSNTEKPRRKYGRQRTEEELDAIDVNDPSII